MPELPPFPFIRKKYLLYTAIGILVLALPVTLYLAQQKQDIRQRAASGDQGSFEVEAGVHSGPVTIGNDQQASEGKYIAFGAQSTPSSTPTPSAVPLPTSSTNLTYPSEVLNLTNWKITLPSGSPGSPQEIKQPSLVTYRNDPWFIVAPEGTAVRFRAPVNGVTTSGSSYPRSELREMKNNGSENANWSSTTGTHTMTLDQKITSVPQTKKHVVAGQIHDAGDDVIVIRLEYPKLFIDINGKDGPVLDPNYTLGKRFTVKFEVNGGKTAIYYNGSASPAYTLPLNYSGAYFKAGAYTQSNCSTERSSSLCNAQNYGEVVIYKAIITHN